MKNFKTFTWYLVFYFLPVFAIACGGRVEYDARNGNGSDPGVSPTAPPMEFPPDPVSSDPPPFIGNDGGIAGSSGSGGSGGSSGSGGTVATGGSSGEAGSGQAGDGGEADSGPPTDAGCKPLFDVEWLTHSETSACPGDIAVDTLTVKLTAECEDMEVNGMRFELVAPDFAWTDSTPFCKAPCASLDDWYFRNLKLVATTGQTVMGPIQHPSAQTTNQMAVVEFTDAFTLAAGESMTLTLQMDVAYSFDSPLPETRIHAILDGLTLGNQHTPVHTTLNFDTDAKVVRVTECNSPELTVSLATSPVSSVHVKKEQDVETVGITAKTDSKSVTLKSITLTGQAQIGTDCSFGKQCAREAFASRVVLLRIFDGSTQVGLAKAPDALTGKVTITDMNVNLAPYSTKTFTVKASLASTASATEPYDQFAVGVETGNDVVARDSQSNVISASMSQQLQWQVYGDTPIVVQTIRPSGTVSIVDDGHPASTIVVGGKDAWVPFARYKATVEYESAKIDRVAVGPGNVSGSQSVAALAIAVNGQVVGQDVPPSPTPSNSPWTRDIDLSSNPIAIPKDGSVQFEVWAKVPPVMANQIGSWGLARSGDTVSLGLQAGLWTGEWDANYGGMLNVRTTGSVSGERLYAPGEDAAYGNPMVLRKSKPFVNKLALATSVLANGADQELFKFQVTPDAAGPVEFAQFALTFEKSTGLGIIVTGLRVGSTEIANAGGGAILMVDSASGMASGGTGSRLLCALAPRTLTGSGEVYTAHGTVSGASPGQYVTISFEQVPSSGAPVTSTLDNPASGPDWHLTPDTGSFIWSDLSEVLHGWNSLDWTNDLYVQDLSQTQVLSAP